MAEAEREVFWARAELVGAALALIAGVLVALGLARALFKFVRANIPALVRQIAAAVGAVERRKVRNAVLDEVVREKTRASMSRASEAEKEAMRSQIQQALASGNYELAQTLTSFLQRIS